MRILAFSEYVNMNPSHKLKKNGFTLVEIALALLVISIGVIAILGLFPAGLEANQRSIGETRAALFAEDVLNGYRALSRAVPWNQLGNQELPAVAADMWRDSDGLRILPNGQQQRNVYVADIPGMELEEFAVRYRLEITDVTSDVKRMRLEVWPGEFGPADEEPIVFLTELFHSGVTHWPPIFAQ